MQPESVERIAILVFGNRVSPRFDVAQEALLVDGRGPETSREHISIGHWQPWERVRRLAALGVTVVICGAISGLMDRELNARRIRVYSWVTGEAEHALACFLSGSLESRLMAGPEGPCGRWEFRGWGRRGRGGRGGRRRCQGGPPPSSREDR